MQSDAMLLCLRMCCVALHMNIWKPVFTLPNYMGTYIHYNGTFARRLQDMTVISLCPGFVATDLNADVRKGNKEMEEWAMKPAVSVTQQLKVIEELKLEDSGLFCGHQGEKYPW